MEANSKTMKILLGISCGSIFLNISQLFGFFNKIPHWYLLIAVIALTVIDFFTAMAKLKALKVEPTSEGQRKSFNKVTQYGGAIAVSYLLWLLFQASAPNAVILLKGTLFAIMFVEVTSIFENLYEADQKSYFAKFIIYPVLKIMKFGMVKNPLMKQMEKLQQQEQAEKNKP